MSKILNTYNRKKISFSKGKGSFLYTTNGKKYLDFVQGIAVNCLGHANDYLIRSINKQSKKLWHVSNVFWHNFLANFSPSGIWKALETCQSFFD